MELLSFRGCLGFSVCHRDPKGGRGSGGGDCTCINEAWGAGLWGFGAGG